jgi:rhodanese-related sulfurtransferase
MILFVSRFKAALFLLLRMKLLTLILVVLGMAFIQSRPIPIAEKYKCLPCGQLCDTAEYSGAGKCEHCQMNLVKASTITFKMIEPKEICEYIAAHPKAVLLDVRTKEEFEGMADPDFGTLKNAINIPIDEIGGRLDELTKYKSRDIIVFCSHSHRSPQVSYLLTQKGFKNVTNMNGGMSVVTDKACKK